MSKTLIIGPPKAGKTALLASLRQAAFNPEKGPWTVNIVPRSDSMKSLFNISSKIIRDGTLHHDADTATNEFAFDIELRKSFLRRWFTNERYSVEGFVLLDGPGGVVFGDMTEAAAASGNIDPPSMRKFRELMVKTAQEVDGLVILVDASQEVGAEPRGLDSVSLLFENLERFFDDLGEMRLKRLAICLHKADRYFKPEMKRARAAADNREELRRALNNSIPLPRQRFLDANLPAGATIAYGWTSSFGFLGDGSSNLADPDDQNVGAYRRLANVNKQSPSELASNWRPFQVLDPFIFMMTGDLGGFQIVERVR